MLQSKVLSRSDLRVMAAAGVWVGVWAALAFVLSALTGSIEIQTDTVAFSFYMGLFIGAIVGAFGSTESRGTRNQNAFVVGAILFGSLLPVLLPGQTPRVQWAYNMAGVGVGAALAFPAARFVAALIRQKLKKNSGSGQSE